MVPSCNSSPGHRPKASGVEVFLLELWSDGAQPGWGFSRCWDAMRPQPTPLPGGATPELEGSASKHGKGPRQDLSPVRGRLASRVGHKQSYSTNIQREPERGRSTPPLADRDGARSGPGSAASRQESLAFGRGGGEDWPWGVIAGEGRQPGLGREGLGGPQPAGRGAPGGGVGGRIRDGGGRGELSRSR